MQCDQSKIQRSNRYIVVYILHREWGHLFTFFFIPQLRAKNVQLHEQRNKNEKYIVPLKEHQKLRKKR